MASWLLCACRPQLSHLYSLFVGWKSLAMVPAEIRRSSSTIGLPLNQSGILDNASIARLESQRFSNPAASDIGQCCFLVLAISLHIRDPRVCNAFGYLPQVTSNPSFQAAIVEREVARLIWKRPLPLLRKLWRPKTPKQIGPCTMSLLLADDLRGFSPLGKSCLVRPRPTPWRWACCWRACITPVSLLFPRVWTSWNA
jgi:hypothetical protein